MFKTEMVISPKIILTLAEALNTPLLRIDTEQDFDLGLAILWQLLEADDAGIDVGDRLESIASLVEEYDQKHYVD